ncbi:Arylsulfatase B [Araneus ventricosus]|uniref:Arylsulfatase B n=1 Tax=Araneus ventricosus TaxID=182803 RepID=A0A4Y2S2U7_ARAVE|nr:Arylsulfatase B [Araneus ventricosus]
MVSALDQSVGDVFQALHDKDMLSNSIFVFSSDNGGETNELVGGYSSNYPLRGQKFEVWEGGIRVPAFIWSPLLQLQEPRVSMQLMHVTDWLPTLYSAAGEFNIISFHISTLREHTTVKPRNFSIL